MMGSLNRLNTLLLLLNLSFFWGATCLKTLAQAPLEMSKEQEATSLEEFLEFLSLPNVAPDPAQLEPNMRWLERAFNKRGFLTERIPTAGLDLLLAERKSKDASKTVLFYVQVDGQPVDPTQWEQEDPFQPVVKERGRNGSWIPLDKDLLQYNYDPEWRIFARSASDAKGPINMFLTALDVLQSNGEDLQYNIKVIMDTEEEMGSPNLPAAVVKYRQKLAADYLVILDGPIHQTLRPTLVFGARGIATVTLTTFGPRVPQHSGHYGNYAPNPALILAQLLATMKDDRGRVVIPGFYDGISLNASVREALAEIPDSEKEIRQRLGIAKPDAVASTLQEAIQYPSLNIRGMRSGWVGEEVRTIVPATAIAEIDVRLVKESDPVRLLDLIRQHIEDQGYHLIKGDQPTDAERKRYSKLIAMQSAISYQAFRTDLDHPVGQWLSKAMERTWGKKPIRIRTHGGSIPISPFVNTLDVPAVAVPLVNPDNNQHSPNENIRMGSYFDGVKSCIGILSTPID